MFIFLSLASMNGSVDVARILVENGADVNKLDKIRKSSLMVRFIGKQRYLNDFWVLEGKYFEGLSLEEESYKGYNRILKMQ